MQYSIEILRNRHTYEVSVLLQKIKEGEMVDDKDILRQASKAIGAELILKTTALKRFTSYE